MATTGFFPVIEGRGFVLLVAPGEARQLLRRDWPDDAWLAIAREPGGTCRWEAGLIENLPAMACGRPVWPPVPGLDEAAVGAEDEAALLRWASSRAAAVEPPSAAIVEAQQAEAELLWDD